MGMFHKYSTNIYLPGVNALWKDFMLYLVKLKLNYNQSITLFRQKQIFISTRHKNLQKQIDEEFFRKYYVKYRKYVVQMIKFEF